MTDLMNFEVSFKLNGTQHHTRDYNLPEQAAEAMANWEKFGDHHTSEVIRGDAALVKST